MEAKNIGLARVVEARCGGAKRLGRALRFEAGEGHAPIGRWGDERGGAETGEAFGGARPHDEVITVAFDQNLAAVDRAEHFLDRRRCGRESGGVGGGDFDGQHGSEFGECELRK